MTTKEGCCPKHSDCYREGKSEERKRILEGAKKMKCCIEWHNYHLDKEDYCGVDFTDLLSLINGEKE